MRLDEIKAEIKLANPTLRRGSEEDGYQQITGDEYEITIESWAQSAYDKELKAQEELEARTKRQALLDKLGITEEEARLLLGGN